MYLYRFNFKCGRSGSLEGMFAVDQRGKVALDALIADGGTEVYFGEVLGKHSDVFGTITEKNLTQVEATADEVAVVLRVFGKGIDEKRRPWATILGFNPIETFAENTELWDADHWDQDRFLRACRGEDYDT